MIFLTVGQELPFDRLVRAVDVWCLSRGRSDVFGQLGEVGSQGFRPTQFKWEKFVSPPEYKRRFEQADIVVAHAGMGSIITALTLAKNVLIIPRQAALKEHRNDHQLATAERFAERSGVHVAFDETMVGQMLDTLADNSIAVEGEAVSHFAEPRLIDTIRNFIHDTDDC